MRAAVSRLFILHSQINMTRLAALLRVPHIYISQPSRKLSNPEPMTLVLKALEHIESVRQLLHAVSFIQIYFPHLVPRNRLSRLRIWYKMM